MMTGKILGILGSPLKEGNTAHLLDHALRGARDAGYTTDLISVTDLDFEACNEHFFCKEYETCIMDDDLQKIYPLFRDLDGIILAFPIMTMGVPGKLKSFMDRFQVYFMAKYLRKRSLVPEVKRSTRRGLMLSIAGMNQPNLFQGSQATVRAFFDIIDCKYFDELLIPDMDRIKDLSQRSDLLMAAYEKGRRLCL